MWTLDDLPHTKKLWGLWRLSLWSIRSSIRVSDFCVFANSPQPEKTRFRERSDILRPKRRCCRLGKFLNYKEMYFASHNIETITYFGANSYTPTYSHTLPHHSHTLPHDPRRPKLIWENKKYFPIGIRGVRIADANRDKKITPELGAGAPPLFWQF